MTEQGKQVVEMLFIIIFPVAANQMTALEYQAWLEEQELIADLRSEAMDLNCPLPG